jgi:outer membrane lipoprotein-sorting protein
LADAKAYLTGSFPLTIETPESIAMQVVNVLFYGLPLDQLQTFRERVNAVTVDDIQRVARAFLRPDRLSVVLVGNAAAFASQLKGVGFSTYETIELGDLDLTAANFKRAGTRAGGAGQAGWAGGAGRAPLRYVDERQQSTITPQEGEKAQALLDQVISAKGGLDKLRGIKTIVAKQTLTNPEAPGRATTTLNYLQYPDRFRIETSTGDSAVITAYDGTEAWMKDPRAVRAAPEQVAREARATLRRDAIALLLAAKDGKLTPRILPDVKDASGHIDHALEISGTDLNPVILYVDPATGLIRKQVFTADSPGRPIVEEQFSDYRAVDGVQIPFTASRKAGPITLERKVTDVKFNTPIDPALFKRPAS